MCICNMDVFEKQDLFMAKMIADYNSGTFRNSDVFKPYMDWKQGRGLHISEDQSWAMRDEALAQLDDLYDRHPHACQPLGAVNDDDPWQDYTAFGTDKYMVSYLEAINEELGNIQGLLGQ